ncbi:hypothetical protein ACFX2I_046437 [Malus domestica]
MPMFGTASSAVDGDEDGSPTIQETRVENLSSGEGFIPKAMGRNKAQKLKEKGKAKDDIAFQQFTVGFTLFQDHPVLCINIWRRLWETTLKAVSKLSIGVRRLVIIDVRNNSNKEKNKEDNHSFASKPDEATGPFPESVLLRQKKVQEDDNLVLEFADAEEGDKSRGSQSSSISSKNEGEQQRSLFLSSSDLSNFYSRPYRRWPRSITPANRSTARSCISSVFTLTERSSSAARVETKVYHAHHLQSGNNVAMKVMGKEKMIRVGMMEQIKRVIFVMTSPWIWSAATSSLPKSSRAGSGRTLPDIPAAHLRHRFLPQPRRYHQDLKPENFLLDQDDHLKVTDCPRVGQRFIHGSAHCPTTLASEER